jgi:hypothetical protein
MTHARIPDFSEPVPVRSPAERRATRAIALDLQPQALEPAQPSILSRAAGHAGELLAAISIIAGGIVLTGLASLH